MSEDTYKEILAKMHALQMAATDIDRGYQAMGECGEPQAEGHAVPLRYAMEKLNEEMGRTLNLFVGPVWGEMSEQTRDACRLAGM